MLFRLANVFDQIDSFQKQLEAAHKSDYYTMFKPGKRNNYPAIDLLQNDSDYVLTAEIPGIKKEDLVVEVKDNVIRIAGEQKETVPENLKVHRIERKKRNFDRSFKLPFKVDSEKVNAEYTDGVLTVTLPRVESEKPTQIKVA